MGIDNVDGGVVGTGIGKGDEATALSLGVEEWSLGVL